MSNIANIGQQKPEAEIKETIQLTDSELDSVGGGGFLDTLKKVANVALPVASQLMG